MRIVFLLEDARALWGGVKTVLEDARLLAQRGHEVRVLARSGPPPWQALTFPFHQVPDFAPEVIPEADLVVGTFWTTVPFAVLSGKGVPVHYCQGYEGDNRESAPWRERIEEVYRLPGLERITISPHLTRLLRERFGQAPREVTYMVDHRVFRPGTPRPAGCRPLRVGLVGPYQVEWKGIPTGIAACELAWRAGLELCLVRATNTEPASEERELPFPFEGWCRVPPAAMGDLYRSLDVFLGTSRGSQEGFFLPAVEAMACGVPCVLTDIPCFRGYGQGQYALFAPPDDPPAMAEALVLAGGLPGVAASLRRAGLAVAARYTPEAHARELEAAFQAILAGQPAPA